MAKRKMRVAIVGAQQVRVIKVVSLMNEADTALSIADSNDKVDVEYLPCVATFDSYENEHQQQIRYLAKVEYHGKDGKQRGSSVAPFFDVDTSEEDESDLPTFPGVSAVAIGCGIESNEDIIMIRTLLKSLTGQADESETKSVVVQCVTPNPEYATMKEETEAFKALTAEEKEEATRLQILGPAKMAKFASSLAESVMDMALREGRTNETEALDASTGPYSKGAEIGAIPVTCTTTNGQESDEPQRLEIDPNKTRYACRKCRTILFGQDQLEDPPHVPMLHSFSRKIANGTSSQCESLFLGNGLDWMGDISSTVEGKFMCPKCKTKIGHWRWAGAQCSCGTWVTPAIQVPFSKVDKVTPYSGASPPGSILSATVAEHQAKASLD